MLFLLLLSGGNHGFRFVVSQKNFRREKGGNSSVGSGREKKIVSQFSPCFAARGGRQCNDGDGGDTSFPPPQDKENSRKKKELACFSFPPLSNIWGVYRTKTTTTLCACKDRRKISATRESFPPPNPKKDHKHVTREGEGLL